VLAKEDNIRRGGIDKRVNGETRWSVKPIKGQLSANFSGREQIVSILAAALTLKLLLNGNRSELPFSLDLIPDAAPKVIDP
jgi:hypothetical protein